MDDAFNEENLELGMAINEPHHKDNQVTGEPIAKATISDNAKVPVYLLDNCVAT